MYIDTYVLVVHSSYRCEFVSRLNFFFYLLLYCIKFILKVKSIETILIEKNWIEDVWYPCAAVRYGTVYLRFMFKDPWMIYIFDYLARNLHIPVSQPFFQLTVSSCLHAVHKFLLTYCYNLDFMHVTTYSALRKTFFRLLSILIVVCDL